MSQKDKVSQKGTNGKAVISFLAGALSMVVTNTTIGSFLAFIGIITTMISLREIGREKQRGKILAWTGLIFCLITIFF